MGFVHAVAPKSASIRSGAHRLWPQESGKSVGHRGMGDVSHMTAELLKQLHRLTMQNIPYSAMAQAVRDLITGDLSMAATLLTRNLAELHAAGKIRLLAVTAPKRLSIAPDIPTAIKAGVPNMTAAEFFYLFAPGGTPAPILQQLNDSRVALTDANSRSNCSPQVSIAGGLDRNAHCSAWSARDGCRLPKPPE